MSKIVQLKKEENLKKPEKKFISYYRLFGMLKAGKEIRMLENLTLPNISGYIKFDNTLHFGENRKVKIWKKKETRITMLMF